MCALNEVKGMNVNMKKGFTLIEILAVVTIIGLIFVIALPKIINSLNSKKSDIDNTNITFFAV